jgi:hypothetical protein
MAQLFSLAFHRSSPSAKMPSASRQSKPGPAAFLGSPSGLRYVREGWLQLTCRAPASELLLERRQAALSPA